MKYIKEIRFRLTPVEKAALIAMAEQAEVTQSNFVRHLLQTAAKRHGLWQGHRGKQVRLSDGGERLGNR